LWSSMHLNCIQHLWTEFLHIRSKSIMEVQKNASAFGLVLVFFCFWNQLCLANKKRGKKFLFSPLVSVSIFASVVKILEFLTCCWDNVKRLRLHDSAKVKTTAPTRYCVRPNMGVVSPNETADVTGIVLNISNRNWSITDHSPGQLFIILSIHLLLEKRRRIVFRYS
jgi:hypothetical protein